MRHGDAGSDGVGAAVMRLMLRIEAAPEASTEAVTARARVAPWRVRPAAVAARVGGTPRAPARAGSANRGAK